MTSTLHIDTTRLYKAVNATPVDAATIVDAIEHDIHARDAIIQLTVNPTMTAAEFAETVEHPHDPDVIEQVEHTFTTVIGHPERFDTDRATRIAHAISQQGRLRENAQDYAAAAFLEWLAGDDHHAVIHALTALNIDEHTTLAGLVLQALRVHTRDRAAARD
ncbi:hypothetical protein [Bifidobacterium rousetti]|uniref:hypothetical protein n=1 Tax=Bifidobacterium rousetti TaxID=2045439 RepID=UPI00168BEECC|nr:hypothetical protein [Bifidobacterium rousetti]